VKLGTGDVEEAPKDGKTYGRKNEAWSEVTTDSYTKAEIDAQQAAQDDEIADKTMQQICSKHYRHCKKYNRHCKE
jgi:hypothetical protein